MSILIFNAGSSSLKFAGFDRAGLDELFKGSVNWRGGERRAKLTWRSAVGSESYSSESVADCGEAAEWVLQVLDARPAWDRRVEMVGHRVVHGGTEFRKPTVIDDRVGAALQRVSALAPLHNPPALTTLAAARAALPDATQVAVFDTAFFADLPPRAYIYPLPYEWYERYGIRRFGFHGISHAYCARRAAELLDWGADAEPRLVICHLGNGCSATAVRGGRAVATTMGFTPMEGLMMGTRSGSVDPGILLDLLRRKVVDADRLDEDLNRHSGLLGVSGVSSDYRHVERAARDGHERAGLAVDMFADRIRSTIGGLAVTLGGLDALVFTAGIGEGSADLRGRVCQGLQCLGLHLDEERNQASPIDANIAREDSAGHILLIATREEQAMARDVRRAVENQE